MRELLNGVYDLHIHTSPDVVPGSTAIWSLPGGWRSVGWRAVPSSATILTLRPGPAC